MKVFDIGQEATGIIAIGQIATGVIALGQVATGVIAIGQIARGVIALGQVGFGVVAVGQIGLGAAYGSGMLGVGAFAGGLVPIPLVAITPFIDLVRGRFQMKKPPPRLTVLRIGFYLLVVAAIAAWALRPLGEALFGLDGILHTRA